MKFPIAQILSAGTGRLCCPMADLYFIYNFLTGDNLYTHQLPRAFKVCQPWMQQQCPWLAQVDESGCSPETWRAWLADLTERFGAEHELQPLPASVWQSQDPIAELIALVGPGKVIVVAPEKPELGGAS